VVSVRSNSNHYI